MPLRRFLETLRDHSGGRVVLSYRTRPRELRNGAAEELTLGLPDHLWRTLGAELGEEEPDEALVRKAAAYLGAKDPAGRWELWGQWKTVSPENLKGHLHELLTKAAAWAGPAGEEGRSAGPVFDEAAYRLRRDAEIEERRKRWDEAVAASEACRDDPAVLAAQHEMLAVFGDGPAVDLDQEPL